ncbi:aldo/keto reductase [Streptococcus acidominimus]|uniref:Aldo/keto reductase n=1 Tax=Streptococcus acidominimus TaxID=1326 RepID=A0A1Q8EFM0_STRAI|nr:aldo/keto reductase [Streptococcus acidominimus]OLF50601.1 aldo/keto reductase [Streptococcus acidominimus]SUN05327.1 aldo/keto reductase family protein [Streptococcus acidominimus]SUN40925.1 aldo/keto reductase family protein [Streptococcus acidominimus]
MKNEIIRVNGGEIGLSKLILGSSDYLKLSEMTKVHMMFGAYVDSGGITIDTARHYGESEAVIGEWLKGKPRSAYTIISKCCHPVQEAPQTPRVTPEDIVQDLTKSLEMLGTDYVDILLLHRDDVNYPVGPLMETLSQLVDEDKVKAFGVSNWTLPRIKEALAYCQEHELHPLSFNSPNFSLAAVNCPRWNNAVTADQEMLDWHRDTQFPLIAWSAQAEGFFGHRFKQKDKDNPELKEFVEVYFNDLNWKRLAVCERLAREKGVKPIQISLAYVLSQPFPVFATIGPEEEWHLRDSLEALDIPLSDEEMESLRKGE